MARPRAPRTAVCVVRIEARGADGVLITVTTTSDVAAASPGHTTAVASVDEAVTLVGSFLRAYKQDNVYNNDTS